MKKTERTFWQKIRLFLSPLSQDKLIYFRWIYIYIIRGTDKIIYVLFLERASVFLENGEIEKFYSLLIWIVIYLLSFIVFNLFFYKFGWTEIYRSTLKFLQTKYLALYVRIDNNYTEKLWTWRAIAILDKWFNKWSSWIHNSLEQWTYIILSVLFTSYMIAKNSTLLFWIFVLLYICIFVFSYLLNIWAIKYRRKKRDWGNVYTKNLIKIIMSKNEVLHSAKIGHESKKLDRYLNKGIFYNKKMSIFLLWMFELPNIMISILIVWVLYHFWTLYHLWETTLAELFWLTTALLVMLTAIKKWIDFFKDFTKEFTDIEKLWDFFDETPTIQWYDTGKNFQIKNWTTSLNSVTFGYTQNQNIFENFDLKLQGEKVTALVWPSGGGKSTLVKLIAWYIHTDKWDIIIDDQKLSEVSLKSYYKNIGYLTQEPSVFDGTIRENLWYALEEEVWEEKMKEVLELAECQFVQDLEQWIDTEIGERGVRLSWGQKQRLAIAKIFLKNPKIIILDEPTSALDSISEKKISNAMEKLFANRTVIIIAHRLQTVKHADEIIYIENWKVSERGNHKELVKQKWLYNEMLELQSGF